MGAERGVGAGRPRPSRRTWWGAGGWRALPAALLLAACNPGVYPVDIFPEMHYQPSQRRLEPERLAPPPGAVPRSGGRRLYTFEQAAALTNPLPRTAAVLQRAEMLNAVNCAMCHGADGRGQSPLTPYYARLGWVWPTSFASPRVRERTDGQLYWLLRHGVANMPPFGALLDDAELWTLVHYVREVGP